MKQWICLLLCLLLGSACAEGIGQSYAQFEAFYAENISLMNASVGLHLLPHTPSRDYDTDGKRLYRYQGKALAAEVHLDDQNEQIAHCKMTLTAPSNMAYGSTTHRNFEVEGYQFYALVMAMDPAATASERYGLIGRINEALSQSAGAASELLVGDYRLTCQSTDGVATMLFENALLMEKPASAPLTPDADEDTDSGEEEGNYKG